MVIEMGTNAGEAGWDIREIIVRVQGSRKCVCVSLGYFLSTGRPVFTEERTDSQEQQDQGQV